MTSAVSLPPHGLSLSILLVNWNSSAFLRKCLVSIRATCAALNPQVVVVDSGSFDGCAEMLAADFPDVEFVQSRHNIGFGRSNNLGLARVTGDALLLLNPDTEIRPGAVQHLLAALRRLPDAGIVGARLLNPDLTLQASVHALPRPVLQAFDSEVLRRLLSRCSLWGPPRVFAPAGPVVVEAVAGACMLLRTSTFREVGGFSPHYFMYAEDMDLCRKVRRAGLRVYHVPHAEIIHHGGGSAVTQGGTFSAVMMREALHTYMRQNHGRIAAATYRLCVGGAALLRCLLMTPAVLVARGEKRRARLAVLCQWRSAMRWSLGLERWAKRYSAGSIGEPGPRASRTARAHEPEDAAPRPFP